MESNKKQAKAKDSIVMQAGVLVIAGFVSKIIGLLYRSPLHGIIGTLGLGYYSMAYQYYIIVLLISSYSIPGAISKVIAQKLAVKEYRNAHRIFLCSMAYVLVVGGVASLVLFFGAEHFTKTAAPVLRTFAPTVFIYGILGVLRGYFQAHRSMVQTSVSQILEQIANAVVSIGGAYLLIRHMLGTTEMPTDEAALVQHATYGAVGSAIGTGAGVLIALLFMAAIYGLNRRLFQKRIARDRHRNVDSYGQILKMITMVVTPFILNTAVYNLRGTVNNHIYTEWFPRFMGADSVRISANWGVFAGQAQTIADIPIALATAIGTSIIPAMSQMVAFGDMEGVKEKIRSVIKSTMVLSIPCAAGIFVLGRPLTGLLFPSASPEDLKMAGTVLMALALSVVFCELSTLNSNVLQGIGKVNTPMINSAIALVLQTGLAVVLVFFTSLDVYGIAIANTVYFIIVSTLNQLAVRRSLGYVQELKETFFIPALASLVMGGFAWAIYEGLYLLTDSMRIAVIPAVLIAMVIYFVVLLLFHGITEEELKGFPKGYLLVRVARKCRLLR